MCFCVCSVSFLRVLTTILNDTLKTQQQQQQKETTQTSHVKLEKIFFNVIDLFA